jgi:hypothetical protein
MKPITTTQDVLSPLPRMLVEPIVHAALLEDLGRAGDITTDAVIPADARLRGAIVAREPGVVAGVDAALLAFTLIDPAVAVAVDRPDGSRVERGEAVLRVEGPARSILSAERVALNLLCKLSGIATATAALVAPMGMPGSSARARPPRGYARWRSTLFGLAGAPTIASGSMMPFSSRTTTSPLPEGSGRLWSGRVPLWGISSKSRSRWTPSSS